MDIKCMTRFKTVLRYLRQYCSYIVVRFIGGGKQRTQSKVTTDPAGKWITPAYRCSCEDTRELRVQ